MNDWWAYENLYPAPKGEWELGERGDTWDQLDYHIDLGCGRIPKARLGIDLRPSPGATHLAIDLEKLQPSSHTRGLCPEQERILARTDEQYTEWRETWQKEHGYIPVRGLPFPDNSIKSIISHHALEHVGPGFEAVMEECYRILEWNGVLRVIVPLFPSYGAVSEYDHKRYFMEGTFDGFCQEPSCSYTDGFSERYNSCCFRKVDEQMSPEVSDEEKWTRADARALWVTLWKPIPGTPMEAAPPLEDYL